MKHIKTIKQVDERGVDTSVHIYRDDSLTKSHKVDTSHTQEDKLEQLSKDSLTNLGFESALQKEERMFKLSSLVEQGKVVTVKSACEALKLSRSTILNYAKETGVVLYDEVKHVWLNDKS